MIKKPVKRENWELNNDDVELIEKIGRVTKNLSYPKNCRVILIIEPDL